MKNRPTSIKELCEYIWEIEDKFNLFEEKVLDVKIWEYIRMNVYYTIAEKLNILQQPHSSTLKNSKLKIVYKFLLNSIKDNFFTLKKTDIIVFADSRIMRVDGEYVDIYTHYLIDELAQSHSVIEIESHYLGEHKKIKREFTHYFDWFTLSQFFLKRLSIFFMKRRFKLPENISNAEKDIKKICQIDFDLESLVKKQIHSFKVQYWLYKKIFLRVAPNKIYLTNSYGNSPLIKAAKDLNIEVNELQHGTFSKYHLGYSFPNLNTKLDYFPDNFLVWSEFWKNIISLPLPNKNIIIDKFRFLELQKIKYLSIKKEPNSVVVLSQGAIGSLISDTILKNIDIFSGKKIFYKLHPGEYERWEEYPSLVELVKTYEVILIKDEIDLYELLARSDTQVGVFSTALYEGVFFDCKTILLNITGIEYMESFIKNSKNIKVI